MSRSRACRVVVGLAASFLAVHGCSSTGETESSDDGSSDACADETDAAVAYLEAHSACETDADCQALYADCLFDGRAPGECSGRFFVNTDATAADFDALNEAIRACLPAPEDTCGGCATDTYLPACNDGTCGPGAEIPDE